MINLAIVLTILVGTMFMATKAVDLLFAYFKIVPNQESIESSKSAQITESVLNSLQLPEYSWRSGSIVDACEIEGEAVCSMAESSLTALSEGLQALAESAIEYISAIIEGLANL